MKSRVGACALLGMGHPHYREFTARFWGGIWPERQAHSMRRLCDLYQWVNDRQKLKSLAGPIKELA